MPIHYAPGTPSSAPKLDLKNYGHVDQSVKDFVDSRMGQLSDRELAELRMSAGVGSESEAMQVARFNNAVLAEQAEIDRDFQLSTMREANAFSADQAELAFQRGQTSAREAMDFEHNEAELQRRFIDQQRSTAYQTAVNDLRAAGLNPALAYSQGGASVTAGTTASGFSTSGSSAHGVSAGGSRAGADVDSVARMMQTISTNAKDERVALLNALVKIGSSLVPRRG